MKNLLRRFFHRGKDYSNLFRVVLTDIQTEEVDDGVLGFICSFILINHQTQDVSQCKYSFVGDIYDLRGIQFFDFLKKSKVRFHEYFELLGMVFDAELQVDSHKSKFFVYKKMVARPPRGRQ